MAPAPTSSNFFDILGVPRRYHLDGGDLEKRFHELSRVHHPDRHVKSEEKARVKSALASAQLNEAYRALKDPVKRAEHLLSLEGFHISDERSGHKVSPAFLGEIMELREGLMDAKGEGDAKKVLALAEDVRARQASEIAKIDAGFAKYEAGDREALSQVADAMIEDRYFRRFLDEVEAFQEAADEAVREVHEA